MRTELTCKNIFSYSNITDNIIRKVTNIITNVATCDEVKLHKSLFICDVMTFSGSLSKI